MQVWVLARAAQAVQFYERRGAIRVAEGTYSVGDHAETAWGYCVVLAATQRAVISGLDHS